MVGARNRLEFWSPEQWSKYSEQMDKPEVLAESPPGLGHLEPYEPPGSGWTVGAVGSLMEQEVGHLPVMLEEVILALSPHPGSFQIDATVGGGGHADSDPGGR